MQEKLSLFNKLSIHEKDSLIIHKNYYAHSKNLYDDKNKLFSFEKNLKIIKTKNENIFCLDRNGRIFLNGNFLIGSIFPIIDFDFYEIENKESLNLSVENFKNQFLIFGDSQKIVISDFEGRIKNIFIQKHDFIFFSENKIYLQIDNLLKIFKIVEKLEFISEFKIDETIKKFQILEKTFFIETSEKIYLIDKKHFILENNFILKSKLFESEIEILNIEGDGFVFKMQDQIKFMEIKEIQNKIKF